ncbi:Receptor-like protein 12 [Dichanthelium oligosanthes]|uniref:Receptor-like protein 12 n=1 Tax=Dichanthelium oligosanthes TaxID=888268 RepID=A0A1E5VX55_9POAL|nr:Receptor-like protein 12 [Dichanthelium oligosanthes]
MRRRRVLPTSRGGPPLGPLPPSDQSMFYMACGCVAEERAALMHVRSSLLKANSLVPDSWGQRDDCCSWERVTCNNDMARVSGLDLTAMYVPQGNSIAESECWSLNLAVFSPFHELQQLDLSLNYACLQNLDGLQGLTKLKYLNVSDNSFIGNDTMGSLGKLASLEVINLVGCNISGTLRNTAFKNLKNMRELHLRSNQLSGSIPSSLFELPRLEYLDLSENLFLWHIPMSSFANISSALRTLKLSGNNLSGAFHFFWLRNCTMLEKIDLSRNNDLYIDAKFHGLVPPFQLTSLMLSGCNIDDSIIVGPNFLDTQHHLQILDLSHGNLTGSIPNWIFTNVPTLVYLNIANNSLVGSIDPMWQHQSALEMINISRNHFVGQLPTNISSVFPNLEVLAASNNIISGYLPPSLCNISSMRIVDLSNNKFTGEVPTCLFTDVPSLGILKLSNNNLGGSIFRGVSDLSVETIYLGSNKFEGTLPSNLSGSLVIMDLHDNKLSGKFDASFWGLTSLQVLSVASNNLSGKIYPAICKLNSLQILDMSGNNFVGSTPNCADELQLYLLDMSRNSLSGFSRGFFNSSQITVLDLRYNQFIGSLDWIHSLSQIRMLLLGGNRFGGQISPNLCHLQYLNIIDLSDNRISGSLPPCIGGISFGYHADDLDFQTLFGFLIFGMGFSSMDDDDPPFMYDALYDLQGFTFSTKGNIYAYSRNFFNLMFGIDLSGNMLSGEIPWEIGNLTRVKSLNLSNNHFTGRIPSTLANMSAIESLDLSHNELNGPIPPQLSQLWSLEVFSVAYNNLSGCIPDSGQFASFSMDSYIGNKNLQNMSLGNVCSANSGHVAPAPEEDVDETSADLILYVVSASFVLSFWATVAFFFCHPYGRSVMLKL